MTPQQNMNTYTPPVQAASYEQPQSLYTPSSPVEAVTAADLLSEQAQAAVAEAQQYAEVVESPEEKRSRELITWLHAYGKNIWAARRHAQRQDATQNDQSVAG